MTITNIDVRRLISALAGTALCLAAVACGSDDETDSTDDPSSRTDAAANATPDASASSTPDASTPGPITTGGDPACLSSMYAPLSSTCKSCACNADPVLAPTCQGPCWDFIGCSSKAEKGPCATLAAGGEAMATAFQGCVLTECGAYLGVPGAEAVRSFQPVSKVCGRPVGTNPAVCAEDIAKLAAALK